MNQVDLINRCVKKDRQAQNLLFKSFEKRVLGICLRYSSSLDEAKDLQQDAFIRIFQSINSKIESLDGWVVKITVNTAIDHFRKKARLPPPGPIENAAAASVAPDILDKLKEEELLAVLAMIAEPYRIVFNLYIIEGFTHREIGEMMQITESTSRSYLVRAKELLRTVLSTFENGKKTKVVWAA